MQSRLKVLPIAILAILLAVGIYYLVRKNQKPHTQNETVNDVITIIQELDKNPKK